MLTEQYSTLLSIQYQGLYISSNKKIFKYHPHKEKATCNRRILVVLHGLQGNKLLLQTVM